MTAQAAKGRNALGGLIPELGDRARLLLAVFEAEGIRVMRDSEGTPGIPLVDICRVLRIDRSGAGRLIRRNIEDFRGQFLMDGTSTPRGGGEMVVLDLGGVFAFLHSLSYTRIKDAFRRERLIAFKRWVRDTFVALLLGKPPEWVIEVTVAHLLELKAEGKPAYGVAALARAYGRNRNSLRGQLASAARQMERGDLPVAAFDDQGRRLRVTPEQFLALPAVKRIVTGAPGSRSRKMRYLAGRHAFSVHTLRRWIKKTQDGRALWPHGPAGDDLLTMIYGKRKGEPCV